MMSPAWRAELEEREKLEEEADIGAWHAAGRPGTYEKFRANRQRLRTRRRNTKIEKLGHIRRQILLYEDPWGNPSGFYRKEDELHGSKLEHWYLLKEKIRQNDPDWQQYLSAGLDLGLDYDEIADEWMSPEVQG